jgi:HJR/Mrr/RecB family endonuclease
MNEQHIVFPKITWVHKDLEAMIKLWGIEKTIKEIRRVVVSKKRLREVVEEIAKRISLKGYKPKEIL